MYNLVYVYQYNTTDTGQKQRSEDSMQDGQAQLFVSRVREEFGTCTLRFSFLLHRWSFRMFVVWSSCLFG